MNEFVPVNRPDLSGSLEKKYLNECIDSGWISSEGPYVAEFERAFSSLVDREFGIAVTNGSVALDIAIAALGIGPGDEVIIPTFTIISCASAVIRSGAKPVLVDCNLDDWNMKFQDIENLINKNTKAIMVVHIYGLPVEMSHIEELSIKYDIPIIEDSAEMHGQTYKERKCGSFGLISTFSFYPNKHITTGEGGMLVTNDPELDKKCRLLRNLYFNNEERYVHHELGWNARMTNLQAALGMAQLTRFNEFILRKREIGALYHSLLESEKLISLPLQTTDYASNIYWVFGVVLKDKNGPCAKEIMSHLGSYGIGTRPFFWPMHLQPVFLKMGLFKGEHYENSEYISKFGFYLPSGLGNSDEEILRSATCLKQVLKKYE